MSLSDLALLLRALPQPGNVLACLVYPGRVYPLSRPRFARGHVYQPLENQKELRAWLKECGSRSFTQDIWVDTFFLFKTLKEPDCDNCVKAVHDALQSSECIENDRRICAGSYARIMGQPEDAVIIIIREVDYLDPTPLPAGSRKRSVRSVKKPSKSRRRSSNRIREIAG